MRTNDNQPKTRDGAQAMIDATRKASLTGLIEANAARGEVAVVEVFGVGYKADPRSNGQFAVYRIKRNSASQDSILLGRADDAAKAVEMMVEDRERA